MLRIALIRVQDFAFGLVAFPEVSCGPACVPDTSGQNDSFHPKIFCNADQMFL